MRSPDAQDPGALTEREVNEDREQAAPRNLLFDAGEQLDQQTLGLKYIKEIGDNHELMLRNYYVFRDFENKLPFAVNSNGQGGSVKLDRLFWGGGGSYTYSGNLVGKQNKLVLGIGIRLNASFGCYFEPAPKRNFYGGFSIRYSFE